MPFNHHYRKSISAAEIVDYHSATNSVLVVNACSGTAIYQLKNIL